MDFRDIFLGPIYIALTYGYIYVVRPKLALKNEYQWFMYGFHAKVVGMLGFSFIYQFYYGGGDTFAYFRFAKIISSLFFSNPIDGIKALFTAHADYSTSVYEHLSKIFFFHRGPQEWDMVRLTSVIAIPCANSYLATASIFNLISFLSLWKLYRTIMAIYPKHSKWLFFAIFFAPSALFWGSSVMKDTVGITCVCYIFSSIMRMVLLKKILWKEVIILLICMKLLLMVRSYLLLVSLATVAIWAFLKLNQAIKSIVLRVFLLPFMILVATLSGAGGVFLLAQETKDFSSEDVITKKLQGFHTDHGTQYDASVYTLGEVEYTPLGLLSKLPESLVVTLFRPFPWEIKNAVMAVASVESLLYALFTLIVLLNANPIGFFKKLLGSPEIIMSLVFVVMLGFVVGLSSYNFGVLVRFKIPLLPFYGIILAIIYGEVRKNTPRLKKR